QVRAGTQPHAQRAVRRQRGLAGPERDRAQPLPLDGTPGRLRYRLPESLATALLRDPWTAGQARSAATAATAGGLALAGAVPDPAGQTPSHSRALDDLSSPLLSDSNPTGRRH